MTRPHFDDDRYWQLVDAHPEPYPTSPPVPEPAGLGYSPSKTTATWRLLHYRKNLFYRYKLYPNCPNWPVVMQHLDRALAWREAQPPENRFWSHSQPPPDIDRDDPDDMRAGPVMWRHPAIAACAAPGPHTGMFDVPHVLAPTSELVRYRDEVLTPLIALEPDNPEWPAYLDQVEIALAWRETIPPEYRPWHRDSPQDD